MKPLQFAACAAIAFAALAVRAETITGSGTAATDNRAVSGFSRVSIALSGKLEIVQGDSEKIAITADDNVLPYIETEVKGDSLRIRFKERSFNVRTKTPIRIALSAKTLEGISVAGSGDVQAPSINGKRMHVSIAGSGDVLLGGKAPDLSIEIAGSGNVKAGKFEAQAVKVEVAGSGDATVWAKDSLKVSVAGSGDVRYYGDPNVSRSVAGSGSVRRLGANPS